MIAVVTVDYCQPLGAFLQSPKEMSAIHFSHREMLQGSMETGRKPQTFICDRVRQ